MRAFLLSFNDSVVPRATMVSQLDHTPAVLNWYAPLQGAVFIVSDRTVQELQEAIHASFPSLFFIVTELVRGYNDGALPKEAWDFINEPRALKTPVAFSPPSLQPPKLKALPVRRLPPRQP